MKYGQRVGTVYVSPPEQYGLLTRWRYHVAVATGGVASEPNIKLDAALLYLQYSIIDTGTPTLEVRLYGDMDTDWLHGQLTAGSLASSGDSTRITLCEESPSRIVRKWRLVTGLSTLYVKFSDSTTHTITIDFYGLPLTSLRLADFAE